jgi:hypothetical protein
MAAAKIGVMPGWRILAIDRLLPIGVRDFAAHARAVGFF